MVTHGARMAHVAPRPRPRWAYDPRRRVPYGWRGGVVLASAASSTGNATTRVWMQGALHGAAAGTPAAACDVVAVRARLRRWRAHTSPSIAPSSPEA
jgi:hypothetical protein